MLLFFFFCGDHSSSSACDLHISQVWHMHWYKLEFIQNFISKIEAVHPNLINYLSFATLVQQGWSVKERSSIKSQSVNVLTRNMLIGGGGAGCEWDELITVLLLPSLSSHMGARPGSTRFRGSGMKDTGHKTSGKKKIKGGRNIWIEGEF